MKLRAEIRISAKFYREGEDTIIAMSENIDPIMGFTGDDLESVLKDVAHIGDVLQKIINIYGKSNSQQADLCGEGEVVGLGVCRN